MDEVQQSEHLEELIRKALEAGAIIEPEMVETFRKMDDVGAAIRFFEQYTSVCMVAKVAKEHSIQETYGSTHADFRQPKLILNKAATPSTNGGKVKVENPDISNADHKKTLTVKKPTANIISLEDLHWVPIKDVRIPTARKNGELLLSGLAVKQDNSSPLELTYTNEPEVQGICLTLIEDALKCLGLSTSEVSPHLEVSIYTMRPDIILVLRREGRIIFLIEVKNPELHDGDVFENENVAGQITSYLVALHALGDGTPMGAIMTYDKIALVTLGDYSDDTTFKGAVEKAKRDLVGHHCPTRHRRKEKVKCKNQNDTPVRSVAFYTKEAKRKDEVIRRIYGLGGVDEDGDKKLKLKAHMSVVHKDKEVFPFLLQALQVAYLKGDGVEDKVLGVKQEDDLGERLAFKVSEESFAWVQVRKELKAKIETAAFARGNSAYFYILGKLGDGSTAAVYLASTTTGNVCAMKSYYLKRSSGRSDIDKANLEEVEVLSMTEKKRWEALYGSRGFKTRFLRLGGAPCLLMPYGRDLVHFCSEKSFFERTRWEAVSRIKDELVRFAQKGFAYKESDLRWSHVLVDKDNKIFFCDLESLEPFASSGAENEDAENVAWKQLEILLKPMVDKKNLQPCLQWVKACRKQVGEIILSQEALQDLIGKDDNWDKRIASLYPSKATVDNLSVEASLCLYALWHFKEAGKTTSETSSPTGSPLSGVSGEPTLKTDSDEILSEMEDEGGTEEPNRKRLKAS